MLTQFKNICFLIIIINDLKEVFVRRKFNLLNGSSLRWLDIISIAFLILAETRIVIKDKQESAFYQQTHLDEIIKEQSHAQHRMRFKNISFSFCWQCFASCWSPKYWSFTESAQQHSVYGWQHNITPSFTTYLAIQQYHNGNFSNFFAHHQL